MISSCSGGWNDYVFSYFNMELGKTAKDNNITPLKAMTSLAMLKKGRRHIEVET